MISLITFSLCILAILIAVCLYWYLSIPSNLPPGPLGLPLLGSALDYFDPERQLRNLKENVKKYGPVFKLYIGRKLVVCLSDFESIQEALVRQGDTFAGRPILNDGKGLVFVQGDLWREQRRFALSTLRDFGVGRPILEPRILDEIEHLTERIAKHAGNGQSFDPQRLLISAVANIITHLTFGRRYDYDDQEFVERFVKLTERSSGSGSSFLTPTMPFYELVPRKLVNLLFGKKLQLARAERQELLDYLQREIVKTSSTYDSNCEPENYVHAFLKAKALRQGSYFDDEQLLASIKDIFSAATDTTVNTLRFGILYLTHHQEVQEKLYKEIKNKYGKNCVLRYADRIELPYAEAVVMETQRLANLAPLGTVRTTLRSTKLMGYDIPEGTIVFPILSHILHNSDYYPEPQRFKPERFLDSNGKVIRDPKLIPFQIGKRVCLGEPLARMELFLILTGLISRFRFRFPDGRAKPTMKPIVGITQAPHAYEVCVEVRPIV